MSQLFPIGVVAEQTGVPAPTLRAWERRYGVPVPQRTASGRRVYTPADIQQVVRLKRLSESGVPPSVGALSLGLAVPTQADETDHGAHTEAVSSILGAIDQYDPSLLEAELRRVMHLTSPLSFFRGVMVPVMSCLSQRWPNDSNLTIAQEHLTTEIFRLVAQDLHRLSRPAQPAYTCIVACSTDEVHVLPLYAIAFWLAARNVRSIVLGARTPPTAVAEAVKALRPDFVALSATVVPTKNVVDGMLSDYHSACAGVPWVIGGLATGQMGSAIRAAGGQIIEQLDDLNDFLATLG